MDDHTTAGGAQANLPLLSGATFEKRSFLRRNNCWLPHSMGSPLDDSATEFRRRRQHNWRFGELPWDLQISECYSKGFFTGIEISATSCPASRAAEPISKQPLRKPLGRKASKRHMPTTKTMMLSLYQVLGLLENALPSTGDLSPSSSDSDNTDHTQHKKPHAHHRRLSSSSSSVSQRLPPVSGHRIPEAQPSKSGTMTKTSFSTLLLHEAFFHVDVDMMNLASTLPSNISTASASASGNENASISQKVPTDIEASRQHKRSLGIDSTVSTAVGNQSEEVHFAHSPDVRAAVRTARNDQSNNRGHRIVIQQVCDLVNPDGVLFEAVCELLVAACSTSHDPTVPLPRSASTAAKASQLHFTCGADGLVPAEQLWAYHTHLGRISKGHRSGNGPRSPLGNDKACSAVEAATALRVLQDKLNDHVRHWETEHNKFEGRHWRQHNTSWGPAETLRQYLAGTWMTELDKDSKNALELFRTLRAEVHSSSARVGYLVALRNSGETLVPPAQALVAAAATHAGCSDKESAGNSSDFDDKASIDAGHKAAKEEEKDGAADWSDDEYPGDDDGFDYDFCAYRSNHPEFDFLRFDRLREREQAAAQNIQAWMKHVKAQGLFRGLAARMRPEQHRRETAFIVKAQASVRRFLHRARAQRRQAAALAYQAVMDPGSANVKSEVDVEDMEATIAALDLSYQPVQVQEQHKRSQSRQNVLLPAVFNASPTPVPNHFKSGPSNANHTLDSVVDNDVQADNETVKPTNITRTAYDRSLVELAEIRGAAAKAKLQALTDQLMVAARRLKRHYQSAEDCAAMSEYGNDRQLHRMRLREDRALLRTRIDEASKYLKPSNPALILAKQCLVDHELLRLPKEEQQRKRQITAQIRDREWKNASDTKEGPDMPWRPNPKHNAVHESAGELFANAGFAAVAALHRSRNIEPSNTVQATTGNNKSDHKPQSQAKEADISGVPELSAEQWRRRDALERLENALVAARQDDSAMAELAASLARFQDIEFAETAAALQQQELQRAHRRARKQAKFKRREERQRNIKLSTPLAACSDSVAKALQAIDVRAMHESARQVDAELQNNVEVQNAETKIKASSPFAGRSAAVLGALSRVEVDVSGITHDASEGSVSGKSETQLNSLPEAADQFSAAAAVAAARAEYNATVAASRQAPGSDTCGGESEYNDEGDVSAATTNANGTSLNHDSDSGSSSCSTTSEDEHSTRDETASKAKKAKKATSKMARAKRKMARRLERRELRIRCKLNSTLVVEAQNLLRAWQVEQDTQDMILGIQEP